MAGAHEASEEDSVVKGSVLAILLTFTAIMVTACSASIQVTPSAFSAPLPPATQTPGSGTLPQPTDTPKPIDGGIQPPLSADERNAQSVAIEFVQAAMTGQQAHARALMDPNYSAMVRNLYDALGLHDNPSGGYQVIPDHREGANLVFAVVLDYPQRQLRGSLTLVQSTQGWQVAHITAAH